MNIALPRVIRSSQRQDLFVNEKQTRHPERASMSRLLWVLGLVAGVAIGAGLAFGIAG